MSNDIKVQKTVFSTTEFNKVVDTAFSTYTQPITGSSLYSTDEFFRMYDSLYYVINVNGDTNSHEYLVKKSSELLTFDTTTKDIQPLLDEIAQLRGQLLIANQQILAKQTAV